MQYNPLNVIWLELHLNTSMYDQDQNTGPGGSGPASVPPAFLVGGFGGASPPPSFPPGGPCHCLLNTIQNL
jgi:hypothetical protein